MYENGTPKDIMKEYDNDRIKIERKYSDLRKKFYKKELESGDKKSIHEIIQQEMDDLSTLNEWLDQELGII